MLILQIKERNLDTYPASPTPSAVQDKEKLQEPQQEYSPTGLGRGRRLRLPHLCLGVPSRRLTLSVVFFFRSWLRSRNAAYGDDNKKSAKTSTQSPHPNNCRTSGLICLHRACIVASSVRLGDGQNDAGGSGMIATEQEALWPHSGACQRGAPTGAFSIRFTAPHEHDLRLSIPRR
jgi:hypothetical protein